MSDEALMAELERQREHAARIVADFEQQMWRSRTSKILTPAMTVLKAHPVFGQGRNIFFAHKQLNLDPNRIMRLLIRMMLRSDAAAAVAWLHRLFKIDRTPLRMVAVVHGVEVKQPISLVNRVSLLPGSILTKVAELDPRYKARLAPDGKGWMLTTAVFEMGTIAASTGPDRAASDSAYDALLDAARAFTITDRGAPVVGTSWTDFVDPDLALTEIGGGWVGARFEGSPSRFRVKVGDQALAWAERYLKMADQSRQAMDVALDRLNLARRRMSPGDQAIDGGICLEALLGDDSSQELTYKLRLRAALLLGRSVDDRKKIREDVGHLYNLRSKMVHGRVRAAKDAARDAHIASRGLEICTQAVRAIVQRKVLPDFARWELTGGPCDSEDG
jgi:hypothetical protein